jgi:hypothetical protein
VEPNYDAPDGPTEISGAQEAFAAAQPPAPRWASRGLRLGVLLVCLAVSLIALVDTRIAWFGLGAGGAQAGGLRFLAGCPGREAPEVANVSTADLPALGDELSRIMPADVGRVYESGQIAASNLWSDDEPQPRPPAGPSTPAAYEVRWWALDRDGNEDDVVADVLEFASAAQAEDTLALAASPRCRSSSSHAAVHALSFPTGARELSWVNPDHIQQWDVLFVRGRRLYRVSDVPPEYLLTTTGARHDELERARAGATPDALACALPAAGCPASASSLSNTSLPVLASGATAAAGASSSPASSTPTPGQVTAYAHAVNLRGYDVPAMAALTGEGSAEDRRSWDSFAACAGAPRSARVLAVIHSPEFGDGIRGRLYSIVAVLPSADAAGSYMAALEGARARGCLASNYRRSLLASRGADGLRSVGPLTFTSLPTPVPKDYRSALPYHAVDLRGSTPAYYVSRLGRHYTFRLYAQGFAFVYGRAIVELASATLSRPLEAEEESFLEERLVGAAQANQALLGAAGG